MAEGRSKSLLDIGRHCQHSECHQLDFLPFTCDACEKMYCLEHRSYASHECPKPYINSRKVVVCEICSSSIETTGKDSEQEVKRILEAHEKSKDCDPSKKKKPKCPVKRCKQILTFSNHSTCKTCQLKVCLAHRFPADHACKGAVSSEVKFLIGFAARNCGASSKNSKASSPHVSSVKAH